jgi:hypothetical protein
VKKITGDELPDFYNIVLERPKDDPDGYDVLFIDAATKVMQYPGGWLIQYKRLSSLRMQLH